MVFLQASFTLVQFLQVPLFLTFLGQELYGIWLLFQILQLIASRSDFGIAIAVSKQMSLYILSQEEEKAVNLYSTSFTTICIIQTVFLFFVWLLAYPNLARLEQYGINTWEFFCIATFMVLSGFMMAQMESVYAAFYSTGMYAYGLVFRGFAQLSWFSCVTLTMVFGGQLALAAAMLFLGWLIPTLGALLFIRNSKPWLMPSFRYRSTELKPLIVPSLSMACLPATQILNLTVPRLIVAGIAGPAGLAVFNAHRQLARVISLIFGLTLAFEPRITAAAGRNDRQAMLNLVADCQIIVMVLAAIAGASLITVGGAVFEFWVGGVADFSRLLFVPLVVVSIVEAGWRTTITPLTAVNRHAKIGFFCLLANVLGLVGLWLFSIMHEITSLEVAWWLVLIELAILVRSMHYVGVNINLSFHEWSEIIIKRLILRTNWLSDRK